MFRFAVVPAVLISLCGSACAAEPVSVEQVKTSVRKAIGRDEFKTLSTGGARLTGTVKFLGMDETCSMLVTPGGDYIVEQSGGVPFTRAMGAKGPWITDIGGETRMLELGEAESARVGSALITGTWLDEPTPLTLSLDAGKTDDAQVVLTYQLPGGLTHGEITIDRKTWRPRGWSIAGGGHSDDETVTLGGEAKLGGVWFPAEMSRVGKTGATIAYTFKEAGPAPTFIRSPYEPASLRPADVTFDAAVPALLESKRAASGHLLVKVLVNGKPGWFIFDTGAGGTVIDTAFADAAGLKPFGDVQAVGVGGAVATAFVRAGRFTVGPATQTEALMTRLDLSGIGKAIGEELHGVLGYNILHRTVAKLTTADGQVSLYDPSAFKGDALKWEKLAVYERHACIQAEFEGHKGFFKLDTGAGTQPVSMHAPAVERFKLLEGRELTDSRAGGVGGFVKVKAGTIAWLEVGGRREENAPATFALESKGAFADPYTLGNLSLKQIGPRDIVFDYAGGRIAFPDRAAASPER